MKLIEKKQNNKGFSLMELLVALAVSAVVITIIGAFVTQGSKFYSTQGNSVNLQNEMQEISNIMADTLQESTYLEINQKTDSLVVYTGAYRDEGGHNVFTSTKGTSRVILWKEQNLYVYNKAKYDNVADSVMNGFRYSKYVTNVNVSINSKCISENGSISQPIMLNVSLEVSNNKEKRSETKTITLRNIVDEVRIGTDIYRVAESGNQLYKVSADDDEVETESE